MLDLIERVCGGEHLSREESRYIASISDAELPALLAAADKIRTHFKREMVSACSIVNAKSGRCVEDCAFCSQSVFATSNVPEYGLLSEEEIVDCFQDAKSNGIDRFGIVTSGKCVGSHDELGRICKTISSVSEIDAAIMPCASLGTLSADQARRLKSAGLKSYHHNLETSERFFPKICTTHTFAERVETVRVASKEGLLTCCGGIFGLGETYADRIDLALMLRDLDVDSVPVNFLVPIPGTRLERQPPLEPFEILKTIALFRMIVPEKDIRVCGGREHNLGDLQPKIFLAGANGIMIGNYLTTAGRPPDEDKRMLRDLNLKLVSECAV